MSEPRDKRRVALIKSLATGNRFYALVEPDRGIQNADAVSSIPDDLLLGIAYPCLEDGLNDFAVIRTTFETLDFFPEDDPIREEMMEIVNDARSNLLRRLNELHDKISHNKAFFLGTDYREFKDYALAIVHRGYPRRNLDSMMKLNVFSSVAEAEGYHDADELLFHFEFTYGNTQRMETLSPRDFIVELFWEVIQCVKNDSNYVSKYSFDKNVFQKFISLMFVNYATTDPMFYGISRSDYGVSADKDMDDTPLYRAIARELRAIEERLVAEGDPFASAPDLSTEGMFKSEKPTTTTVAVSYEQAAAMLPGELVNEDVLLGPITSLCSAAQLLLRKTDPETQRFARVILADASKLVQELKRLNIVSPLANDPGVKD